MERLQGRVAIVTGGSRGIGAAIAEAFAAEGAKVVISSRKQEGLDACAARINERFPGLVLPRACHVGREEDLEALVSWTESELGLPTVLVNNAGTNPYFGPLLGASRAAWDKTFDVNLRGYFELTRRVVLRLQAEGRGGSVINVASILALRAAPLQGVYGMTKAAVVSMTKTLAVELGSVGIRVNAIAPGLVETRLAGAIVDNADLARQYHERSALRRHAQPDEIAGLAVYLASEESSFVTGQVWCADGGYTTT